MKWGGCLVQYLEGFWWRLAVAVTVFWFFLAWGASAERVVCPQLLCQHSVEERVPPTALELLVLSQPALKLQAQSL